MKTPTPTIETLTHGIRYPFFKYGWLLFELNKRISIDPEVDQDDLHGLQAALIKTLLNVDERLREGDAISKQNLPACFLHHCIDLKPTLINHIILIP